MTKTDIEAGITGAEPGIGVEAAGAAEAGPDAVVSLDPAGPPDALTSDPSTPDPSTKDTRERILDVALELFTEQGFDGTSLREIAERLGVTKAAIYYHFESKEDILLALHLRLHEFGKDALARLGGGPVTLAQWGALLDGLLDQMLEQRTLFMLHERNQAAFEKLHRREHEAEHEDISDRFRQLLSDTRVPLRDRVRMAGSFGAVFTGLFLTGDAFAADDVAEIGDLLRAILHDVVQG